MIVKLNGIIFLLFYFDDNFSVRVIKFYVRELINLEVYSLK